MDFESIRFLNNHLFLLYMEINLSNVGWGFTKACNLNCKHCYNASGQRGKDELSLDEAKEVVKKLKENNVKTINYGTGECGLVPEFFELIEYVNKQGILQGLTTNGYSVNTKTIHLIKKYMNDVDVSIDYPNEEEHNEFRCHKDSWKWAITALDLLKENNIPFSIVTCIHKKNCTQKHIEEFLKIAKKYSCDFRINWFRPTGRGKHNEELKLSVEEVNEIVKYLLKNTIIKALPDPYLNAVIGLNNRVGCPCGKESFRITPEANVVPCVYFTKEMKNVNIKTEKFETIAYSEPFKKIRSRVLDFCKDCEYLPNCQGGCASRAFLEYGTMDAPDVFCYKKQGIKDNPFKGIEYEYKPEKMLVHENYLCTIIVTPK